MRVYTAPDATTSAIPSQPQPPAPAWQQREARTSTLHGRCPAARSVTGLSQAPLVVGRWGRPSPAAAQAESACRPMPGAAAPANPRTLLAAHVHLVLPAARPAAAQLAAGWSQSMGRGCALKEAIWHWPRCGRRDTHHW